MSLWSNFFSPVTWSRCFCVFHLLPIDLEQMFLCVPPSLQWLGVDVSMCSTFSPLTWSGCFCVFHLLPCDLEWMFLCVPLLPSDLEWMFLCVPPSPQWLCVDVSVCSTFSPVTWSVCFYVFHLLPIDLEWMFLCVLSSSHWLGMDVSVCSTFCPLTWSGCFCVFHLLLIDLECMFLCVPLSFQWSGTDTWWDWGQVWYADSFLLNVPVRSYHRFYQGLEAVPGHALGHPSAGHFIWLHDESKCDEIYWPFHLASWWK